MNPSWNQRAVDGFFQNLSSGSFHPAGPLEVLGFLSLVGLVALFFFAYTRRARFRLHGERRGRSSRAYHAGLALLNPSPAELELLELLVEQLAQPDIEKHLVFRNREVFDRLEATLLQLKPDRARALMALRVRMGYGARVDGRTLRNSADIPPGTMLADADGRECFRVLSVHPGFLLAESRAPEEEIPGKALELFISRPDGKYRLHTTILKHQDGRAALQHDDVLKRIQVRDFFRGDIALPVRLNGHSSETLNLSGGGLCIRRPPGEYAVDDVLKLTVELEPLEPGIQITTRVVHADHPGRLHLEFQRIREGDRDRIIRMLMDLQRRDVPEADSPRGINLDTEAPAPKSAMDFRDETGSSFPR